MNDKAYCRAQDIFNALRWARTLVSRRFDPFYENVQRSKAFGRIDARMPIYKERAREALA